jgi:4-hydroxybenzoate polyprenyltransferase
MKAVQKIQTVHSSKVGEQPPLCIDLDDTLLKTDTLLESLLLFLKRRPLGILFLPFWLARGKAHLKRQVARKVTLDVISLPYRKSLLEYLVEQHRNGREIILATAAEESIAQAVANHLGLFSKIIASGGTRNMSGSTKLAEIQDQVGSSFVYAGNATADLPIWRSSRTAILVNAPARLARAVEKHTAISHIFDEKKNPVRLLLTALRPHQWVKNGLLFVPLIASHQVRPPALAASMLAFVAFTLCSSSAYLLNDVFDLDADRRHPTKRYRPFASGDLTVKVGLFGAPLLFIGGLVLSLLLPLNFTLVLCAYFFSTIVYSVLVKRLVMLDVILLALLYTVRVIAGGIATSIHISNWLFVFSMFLFLSLALLKRYSELKQFMTRSKEADDSRGYTIADTEQLASMGSASGYITALVLGLYINTDDVRLLYQRPEFLWLVCPLILYWVSRTWLIARRGAMNDDPVVFAIKDKTSYVIGAVIAAIIVWAV